MGWMHANNCYAASKPQLNLQESRRLSVAASDCYYSLSDRSSSPSSNGLPPVPRHATPDSNRAFRTPFPEVSGTSRKIPELEATVGENGDSNASPPISNTGVHFGQDRVTQVSSNSDTTPDPRVDGGYNGGTPTPGVDDTPYLRYAIDQLARLEEDSGGRRQSDYPVERMVWDEGLGYFTRSPRAAAEQPLLQRPVQRCSADLETFVAVDPPEGSLIYPPLDYVPVVLRWWALTAIVLCCLLMIAGVVFCNVWSQRHQGLWDYDHLGGSRYFVVQFLPQILAAVITIWTFVIQAAVYRVAPFAIMASKHSVIGVLQNLPVLSRNFIIPDLSHFRHGEVLIGFSLYVIWFANFLTIPFISCLFQAKYFVIDGQGTWRWTSVQPIGWLLVGLYGLLTIGLLLLLIRFIGTWSGLLWDPTCLADLIPVIQRSNILPDFADSETAVDVRDSISSSRTLRLGYWQLSNRAEVFYGIGEADSPIRSPSLHRSGRSRGKQPHGIARDQDLEHQGKDTSGRDLYSPSTRYRWMVWFLRKTFVIAWIVSVFMLFIAFVLVSFIHNGIRNGFPPKLPTFPSEDGFSPSNFLYSFIPAFIGNVFFLAWQPIDVYFRALQPFAELASPTGAPAARSLLLSYPSCFPIEVTALALFNGHYKVAWISLMSVVSAAIPILSGGVFMVMWYPSYTGTRVTAVMPAFYALVAFCALYTVSFLCIFPRRSRRHLPHDITTLADLISFMYQSPLLSDKLLREPRSKTDLVTRLVIARPGERERPMYGFGVYGGRDGRGYLGIDQVTRYELRE